MEVLKLKENDDGKFDKLIGDLLDEEELKLLKKIVRNKGELEEKRDV